MRMLAIACSVAIFTGSVHAHPCEIHDDARDPNPFMKGTTSKTTKTHFSWASDADPYGGFQGKWGGSSGLITWHRVQNHHDWRLAFQWPDAGLYAEFGSPLGTEEDNALCGIDYPASAQSLRSQIETTNDGVKNALAYLPTVAKTAVSGMLFEPSWFAGGAIYQFTIDGDENGTTYMASDHVESEHPDLPGMLVAHFDETDSMQVDIFSGHENLLGVSPKALGIDAERFTDTVEQSGGKVVGRVEGNTLLDELQKFWALKEYLGPGPYLQISAREKISLQFEEVTQPPDAPLVIILYDTEAAFIGSKVISNPPLEVN